jgi:hypothetical protein
MTKTDIIRKLTSRKLWLAVALFVSGLITAFGGSDQVAATVAGCIMQGAAVLGYLLAEGLTDAARSGEALALEGIAVEDLPAADLPETEVLEGIDVDDLDDDQLRELLVQLGLSRTYADSLTRLQLLAALGYLSDEDWMA